MIYVTERGLSAPGSGTGGNAGGWAKGVDVHSGESGLFPLEAVRPVSSGKEVEIEVCVCVCVCVCDLCVWQQL